MSRQDIPYEEVRKALDSETPLYRLISDDEIAERFRQSGDFHLAKAFENSRE